MNSVSNVILFHSRDVNHSVSRSVSLLFILSSSSSCCITSKEKTSLQSSQDTYRLTLNSSFSSTSDTLCMSLSSKLCPSFNPCLFLLSFSILLRKHRHFKVKYCRNFFLRRKRGRDFRLKIAVNDYMIQFGKESKGKGIEGRKGT